MSSTRKLNVISEKNNLKILNGIFEKIGIVAYSFFIIDGKIMVDLAGESA